MELKDTIKMMQSDDYKERFKAEYWQLKIRRDKLNKFCNKLEARDRSYRANSCEYEAGYKLPELPKIEHNCPLDMLRTQLSYMGELLHVLEIRAEMELIDLEVK